MIKIQIIFVLRNKLCKYYGNLNMELMKDFKKAQSLNDKMFSLEDVRSIIKWLNENYSKIEDELAKPFQDESKDLPDDFFESAYGTALDKAIQSIQQTEWDVEVNEFNQITKILWKQL